MDLKNRREYEKQTLRKKDLPERPLSALNQWLQYAKDSNIIDYNAFHLATSDLKGNVSGRYVLLKEITDNGLVFFTNYKSKKGIQIGENAKVAITFYWSELEKQIRIEGVAKKLSNEANDTYFYGRSIEAQAAASACDQSKPVSDRNLLESLFHKQLQLASDIKRPQNWGGYMITPLFFEFWQGRENRLNDRITYSLINDQWVMQRIAP